MNRTPTQVRRPWRSTVRTVFQLAVAIATLLPFIATGVYQDVDQAPAVVGQVLAAAAAVTRVMALPQVEVFLRSFVPWLAAAPAEDSDVHRRDEVGTVALHTAVLVLVLAIALISVVALFPAVRG